MPNQSIQSFDVVTLGELLIDMVSIQRNIGLFDTAGFKPEPGGAPANVAVGVRRLGKSSAFIGKIGRDEFGIGLRRTLDNEGVFTGNLIDDPAVMTSLAFVSLAEDGSPHFAFFAGAHTHLEPSDLDSELIRKARIFHFGSVSLAHEPSRTATLAALEIARANQVICTYDINWRPALWSDPKLGLQIALEPLRRNQLDIFKMNAAELALITGQADPHDGLAALDVEAQVPLCVVTMAEKGCLYRFNGKIFHQSVPSVETVIDSTGAGDAFMAAMLTGLRFPLVESDLAPVMRRACQAGAITTTRRGAIPALPSLHDLDPLLLPFPPPQTPPP